MSNKSSHRLREAGKQNESFFSKELTTHFNETKRMGQNRQSQSKTNPYFFKANIKTIQHHQISADDHSNRITTQSKMDMTGTLDMAENRQPTSITQNLQGNPTLLMNKSEVKKSNYLSKYQKRKQTALSNIGSMIDTHNHKTTKTSIGKKLPEKFFSVYSSLVKTQE